MYELIFKKGFPYNKYDDELSEDMTVYQEAHFQKEMFKNMLFYSLPRRMKSGTFVLKEDGKTRIIFPAMFSDNSIELAGDNQGTSNLGLIYFKSSEENLEVHVRALIEKLQEKGYDFIKFIKMSPDSRVSKILKNLSGWKIEAKPYENVKIDIRSPYDEWRGSLSKSTRQNLRTAYNRLKTDEKTYEIKSFRGGNIPSKLMKKLVSIYNNRHSSHYGVKTTMFKRFYMQHMDFSTRDLKNNEDAMHYVLYIEDKIAAFFSGYIDKKTKTVIIPRLSIDPMFNRYSPGYILLNETINDCKNNNLIEYIDLSSGTEKYKTDMGGEIYYKENIILKKVQ